MMQPPQWTQPAEAVLYQDIYGVTVTTARFVVGGSTYPIHGLAAVRYTQTEVSYAPVALVFFAVLAVSAWLLMEKAPPGYLWLACLIPFVPAIALATQLKATFVVQVITAGGQFDAVLSQDSRRTGLIVAALNQAIGSRR